MHVAPRNVEDALHALSRETCNGTLPHVRALNQIMRCSQDAETDTASGPNAGLSQLSLAECSREGAGTYHAYSWFVWGKWPRCQWCRRSGFPAAPGGPRVLSSASYVSAVLNARALG